MGKLQQLRDDAAVSGANDGLQFDEPVDLPRHRFRCGQPQNTTAYNTKLNAFLCPSDPNSGITNLCNYAGSIGTTTYSPEFQVGNAAIKGGGDTTGIFTMWKSYGIQNVTDGTSNTLAFAEALVGNYAGGTGYGQRHTP